MDLVQIDKESSLRHKPPKREIYQLWAVALLANLFVFAVSVYSLTSDWHRLDDLSTNRTRNLVQAVDLGLGGLTNKLDLSLKTMVTLLENHRLDSTQDYLSAVHAALLNLHEKELTGIEGVFIFDAQGHLIKRPGKTSAAEITDRSYFNVLAQQPDVGLFVSAPVHSQISNEACIVFARRFNTANNHFAGIVAIPVPLRHIVQLLAHFDVGPHGILVIRDAHLGLLVRVQQGSLSPVALGSQHVSAQLSQAVQQGLEQGSIDAVSPLDGIERKLTFRKIPSAQIYVLVGLAKTDYLESWYGECMRYGAFCLIFMLSSLGATFFIARYWRRHYAISMSLQHSNNLLRQAAFFDPLTGLPNRRNFNKQLADALKSINPAQQQIGVCVVDLDDFQQINLDWGYETGNKLLMLCAARLRELLRPTEMFARFGGDEFLILLCKNGPNECIEDRVHTLLDALAVPLVVDSVEISLTASMGLTIFPADEQDAETLMRHAEQALFQAKQRGKNCSVLFDYAQDRHLRHRRELYLRLVEAYESHEFCLYYQPKVNMREGKVIGAEALIRWRHPEHGVQAPASFLPALEGSDFSFQLGEWVIREALRQMDEWHSQGLSLPISVNIAGDHLLRPDFVQRLKQLLVAFPAVSPQMLELEILETSTFGDIQRVTEIIGECARLGVGFALDDFGTGYSSLTYFRCLPAHTIKLDQSFVRGMLDNENDANLIGNVIALAHSFHRKVIAEGVETVQHGIPLMRFGCHLAQGYGVARPMPAEQLPEWISTWQSPAEWQQFAATA